MADIKELGNSIRASLGALISGGVLLVISTWVGAEIYFEFQHLKRENARVEQEYKKEIFRLEGRLNKITGRNADDIEEVTDRVSVLERPNSDK